MKVVFETEFVQVNYDEVSNSVIAVWKQATTTSAYRQTFWKVLEVVKANKAMAFISDIYCQGVVGTENRQWMESDILPEAVKFGLRKIVIVAPEDDFKEFYVMNVMCNAKNHNGALEYNILGDLISAQAWVMNKTVVL